MKLLKIVSCFYPSTYKPSFIAQWYSRADFRVRVACFLPLFSSASARGVACIRASASDIILSHYWIQSNFWQVTRDPADWQAVASGSEPDHMDFTPPTQRSRKNRDAGLIHQIQHEQQGQQLPVPLCLDCGLKKPLSPKGSSFRLPSPCCSCWVVLDAIKVCMIVVTD